MSQLSDESRAWLATLPIGVAVRERAALTPEAVVAREKDRGIYREHTWCEYWQDVRAFALGLLRLGLNPGEAVAIMSEPTYRWMVADAAVLSLGGISFGVYTTSSPEDLRHQLVAAEAAVLIVENQEYVDKYLEIEADCPTVRAVIVDDTRTLFAYRSQPLHTFDDILRQGAEPDAAPAEELDRRMDEVDPDDPALYVFTSGTSGRSKAAVLSHACMMRGPASQLCEAYPELTGPGEKRVISHLSLAHGFEKCVALYSPILASTVVHFGESVESLSETLFEVQPYMFHAVPRVWQKMAARAVTDIERAGVVKRWSYAAAMTLARAYRRRQHVGGGSGIALKAGYALARALVFRPMLRKFGLLQTKLALSGGSSFPPNVQQIWQQWGLNLHNLLGQTEAGFVAFPRQPFSRPGTVGTPLSSIEIRIADDGELLYRGQAIFKGYYKEPELTRSSFTPDGWFKSGDIGRFNEFGDLEIIDRKKDIMITAGGKNLTPSLIENAMKASPYISEFVLVADNRKFPAGLVEIDTEMVEEWAKANNVAYTGFQSLVRHPAVLELIEEEITRANSRLARVEQVKKFRIVPRELDPEQGDTTPTRKIRRAQFYEMFRDLIDDMYVEEIAEMQKL